MSDTYVNIRDMLGSFIGKRVVDITQHDEEEWRETRRSYVLLHFEDGSEMKFYIMDDTYGFVYNEEGPLEPEIPDDQQST